MSKKQPIAKVTLKSGETRYHVRFRYRVPNPKYKKGNGQPKTKQHEDTKSFSYYSDAQSWLIEQQQQHLQGKRKHDTKLAWLYKSYFDTFKKQHLRPASQYVWQQVKANFLLKYFGEDLVVSDITRERYQRTIDAYAGRVSHATAMAAHKIMREVFGYAVEEGYVTTNPTSRVKVGGKPSREVEYLSAEEAKKVLKYISEHKFRKRDGLDVEVGTPYMLAGLLLTGCREGELAGLTWDRVDVDKGLFRIDRQWHTSAPQAGGHRFGPLKTKASYRTVSVPKSFISMIQAIKAPGDTFVFNSKTRRFPASERPIALDLYRILDACDLHKPGFHVHSLRHSHVALLLDEGIDIYSISKRLGHARFSTTLDTYAYLIDESKKRSDDATIKALDKLL